MTEFASLRDALDALRSDMDSYSRTVSRSFTAATIDREQLWNEIADLRDDLHAVANRVEPLLRAALRDGEDVA